MILSLGGGGSRFVRSYGCGNMQVRLLERYRSGYDVDSVEDGTCIDSSGKNKSKTIALLPLPPHLERELYKEERRERMIPRMTRKKPMYDNIVMSDPQGNVLATVSTKKAQWDVRKNLAQWNDDRNEDDNNNATSIRLLFTPKTNNITTNHHHSRNEYNASIKQNRCVGCGSGHPQHPDDDKGGHVVVMKHYIVPYAYRSLFPLHFKTHLRRTTLSRSVPTAFP